MTLLPALAHYFCVYCSLLLFAVTWCVSLKRLNKAKITLSGCLRGGRSCGCLQKGKVDSGCNVNAACKELDLIQLILLDTSNKFAVVVLGADSCFN